MVGACIQVIETRSAVSALAYSPAVNSSGEVGPLSLAIGDAGRQVSHVVYTAVSTVDVVWCVDRWRCTMLVHGLQL